MPRLTHPPAVSKHSRAHLREQRNRIIDRNWGRAKARHGRPGELHPEIARANPAHPDAWWPFTLTRGELARNPFNLCSCWSCSVRPPERRRRRRREKRAWQRQVDDALEVGARAENARADG